MKREEAGSVRSKLRACLNCSLIQPITSFRENGCPNCPFLKAKVARNLNLVTSPSFRGMISLLEPKRSWVGRWQRIDGCVPGTYAMTVSGELPGEFIDRVESEGRVYFNRAESFTIE